MMNILITLVFSVFISVLRNIYDLLLIFYRMNRNIEYCFGRIHFRWSKEWYTNAYIFSDSILFRVSLNILLLLTNNYNAKEYMLTSGSRCLLSHTFNGNL